MLKKTLILTLLFVLTLTSHGLEASIGKYSLSGFIKPVSPENYTVYEFAIVPWIKHQFSKTTMTNEDGVIRRGLTKSKLLHYENIQGQDRYNVHIEYRVTIEDNTGIEVSGLKGQEVIFWVEDGEIRDFFPFEEYWINHVVKSRNDYY